MEAFGVQEVPGVQKVPSCTPKSLQSFAAHRLARMLIDSAVPLSLRKYTPDLYTPSLDPESLESEELEGKCKYCQQTVEEEGRMLEEYEIDKERENCSHSIVDVILAEAGQSTGHLLPPKQKLLEHLQEVMRWWCQEGWLGGRHSVLACEVRRCCYERLGLLPAYRRYPLLLLTLQLLFCPEAGHTAMMMKEVSVPQCATLGRFLSELQPFMITKLYTSPLDFSCPSIIATICKFSPMLKFIHLRIRYAVGTWLREIGKVTPNLQTLIIFVRDSEIRTENPRLLTQQFGLIASDFEDQLFFGFFDGMSKEDIAEKIEQGEMKDVPLSFPQLKYVDVGSDRYVREFLHYLLHLYPDLRSINCDGEHWIITRYPLLFPTVTPSALGSAPAALEGCKKVYSLCDMSFSSVCLVSQLPVIMERYKNLEHIKLQLLTGFRELGNTGQLARDLLLSTSCHCLTIGVNNYVSDNDLVSLYQPALQATASMLTVLQFHLTNKVKSSALRQLINMCHTLQELAVVSAWERCEVVECEEGEESVPLNKMPTLKCLGISSQCNVTFSLFRLTIDLLSVSPNLITLDLEFGGRNFTWLLNAGIAKKFLQLRCLRLSLVYRLGVDEERELSERDLDTVFEPVIAAAPRLTQLLVGRGCNCLYKALHERYGNSGLRVSVRSQPCVAFRALFAR